MGRLAALLLLSALLCSGCTEPQAPVPEERSTHPVLLVGVDGLEWNVLLPLAASGRLPVLADLIERGSNGLLETFEPTQSPILWTSIATGKTMEQHGITGFSYTGEDGAPRLFTSADRRVKALWNIVSENDRTVHTIGWWNTFPVEPVNGLMVAQTNTLAQLRVSHGHAVWKGTLVRGVPDQVHPPTLQNSVLGIAERVHQSLPELAEEIFGTFPHELTLLDRRLWVNTQWSLRADTTYAKVAERALSSSADYDLMSLYFGGTDVVAHRFWRYMYPDEFQHRPSDEQIENFQGMIEDYYRYVDRTLGRILAASPEALNVLVVSDHGMHSANRNRRFDPDDPPANVNSGDHGDAPAGVLIAAGPDFATDELGVGITKDELPSIGSVFDVAPTVLTLLDLPYGRDMTGRPIEAVLDESLLAGRPFASVESHDTDAWRAGDRHGEHSAEDEAERLEQLRSLGYIQ